MIINHGYSVGSEEYTFIAEPLSKQGYFVVSIQQDLPDDPALPRTGNLYERRKPFWDCGVQNILFVLAELERIHKKYRHFNKHTRRVCRKVAQGKRTKRAQPGCVKLALHPRSGVLGLSTDFKF